MRFNKMFKKRIISFFTVAITVLTSVSGMANKPLKADAGICTDIQTDVYYYIRNAHSNKYLDVRMGIGNPGDSIIQYYLNDGKGQMFKFVKEATGYSIRPACNPVSAITLQNQASANTNGTDAYIYPANRTWVCQRFYINNSSDEIHGSVEFATVASNNKKVLEVENSYYSDWAQVQIWERGTNRANDNWFLEPATEEASYIAKNKLDHEVSDVEKTLKAFEGFGYTAKRYDMPTQAVLKDRIKASDSVIFLGHGNWEGLSWKDKNNNTVELHIGNNPNYVNQYFPRSVAITTSFVYIGSCQSANLAKAIYDQGVRCTIGFKNSVAGAEDFIRYVMEEIEDNPALSIEEAVNNVIDGRYGSRKYSSISPANSDNLVIYGDRSMRLGKVY